MSLWSIPRDRGRLGVGLIEIALHLLDPGPILRRLRIRGQFRDSDTRAGAIAQLDLRICEQREEARSVFRSDAVHIRQNRKFRAGTPGVLIQVGEFHPNIQPIGFQLVEIRQRVDRFFGTLALGQASKVPEKFRAMIAQPVSLSERFHSFAIWLSRHAR